MYKSYQVSELGDNFTEVPNNILLSPFVSPEALKLYVLLRERTSRRGDGYFYTENKILEDAFCLSMKQIRRYFRELEDLGIIKREHLKEKGKVRGASVYLYNEINISKEKEKELIQKRQKKKETTRQRFLRKPD